MIQRILTHDKLGRRVLVKNISRKPLGYIIVTYPCRALEWLNLRKIFTICLERFDLEHLAQALPDVMFSWRYHDNLSSIFYKPAEVFKKFSFVHLLDCNEHCICLHAKRLTRFLDSQTSLEGSAFGPAQIHVRTVDVNLIQQKELRDAVSMGLNHIPVKPTNLAACVSTALDAFDQLCQILNLETVGLPIDEAKEWIRSTCLAELKHAAKNNRAGLRFSGHDLLAQKHVQNEISWITSKFYCSGLDKATNNICFVCIKHVRLLALERLSGPDFVPCKDDTDWILPSRILLGVTSDISALVPQLKISSQALPYLMSTFKMHKGTYRWLTNAFRTVYSNVAHMLTIATMVVLDLVKDWAKTTEQGYRNFLRCQTSMFWLVNSSIEVALNLPQKIHDVFVADITRCYETIPVHGPDNLIEAVSSIIKIGFRQARKKHPRSDPRVWIRVDNEGCAARAIWASSCPSYGVWFDLTEAQLIEIHSWLMTNCYVSLGDRVWKQKLGIPMGFSCSPLWCNLYLLHYEINFIQRLARLGRADLMTKFQSAYRYIDDLCWVNTTYPMEFLSPNQARTDSNPYWIYPLNVLEIKCEVSKFAEQEPARGIQANFMNMEIKVSEQDPTMYSTRKYDKRRALPFVYTQYIKFRSNRPIKQSYSIAVSQSVPILYLSSTTEAATTEIRMLIQTLTNNGFHEPRVRKTILDFLNNNEFPGVKFDMQQLCANLR